MTLDLEQSADERRLATVVEALLRNLRSADRTSARFKRISEILAAFLREMPPTEKPPMSQGSLLVRLATVSAICEELQEQWTEGDDRAGNRLLSFLKEQTKCMRLLGLAVPAAMAKPKPGSGSALASYLEDKSGKAMVRKRANRPVLGQSHAPGQGRKRTRITSHDADR